MEVEARIVRLQLAETFVIAREQTDYADVVHVAVTHEGTTGYGEAAPVDRYGESDAVGDGVRRRARRARRRRPVRARGRRRAARVDRRRAGGEVGTRRRAPRPPGEAPRRSRVQAARAAANRAADLVDDLARRPGRHGAARRAGSGDVPPAQAQARRWRRPRRRACSGRPRRDRPAAHGRRQRVVVPRRGARRAPAARGDRRRVLRAAAPRRRRGRARP